MKYTLDTLPERFKKKVEIDHSTGCWIWVGARSGAGYGYWGVDCKPWRVHRYTYQHFVGSLIDGLVIDHICVRRICCNPEHLRQVTQSENLRNENSTCVLQAMKTHCVRGHEFTPENTSLQRGGTKRVCRACKLWHSRTPHRKAMDSAKAKRYKLDPVKKTKASLTNKAWRDRKRAAKQLSLV